MEQDRILIVEDERIIALDLRRRLERFGYQVVGMASRPDEAIELAAREKPDLVLMDIKLSDRDGPPDGISAATTIRQEHRIPVVFLTAYADDTTIQRAKIAEPVGYVLKPFKERELHTTIDIGLYKSRVERELLRQERLFSSILRSAGDAIVATNASGIIQFMNPVAETLTGWREDEARGQEVNAVISLIADSTEETISIPVGSELQGRGTRVFESIYLQNKFGAKIHIEGSLAEIRGDRGEFEGLTLAFHDITDIKRLNETVSYQASHDALTGLINRDEFASQLERIATAAERADRAHAFLFVDIDQFKVINEVCGHLAGDELLCQTSDTIQELLESHLSDTSNDATRNDGGEIGGGPGYVLGRVGGDQFGLIVMDAGPEESTRLSKSLVAHLNRKFVWDGNSYNVTVSIGAAPIARGNSTVNDILAAGDDACSLVKEHGGNGVEVYQTSDFVFLRRKGEMQWIARLTDAIEKDRFALYHQVIVPLNDDIPGSEQKYEILLRLREQDGGLVSPGEFITAAERYRLMPSIDKWVVAAACKYVSLARKAGIPVPVICVNLSGASLVDDRLLNFILLTLDQYEVDASSFCLEITETSAIRNFSRAISFMTRLREAGATFALDDFGNGFSSFAYLKRLPVDYLKIDGSFVKDIEHDQIDLAMVEAVNNIGHTMGMRTIAEYVHNDTIREMLRDVGVDFAQGFAVSRPVPLPHAEKLLSGE